MIGSIPVRTPRELGTLLESACPVCSEYIDQDDLYSDRRPCGGTVTCEECYLAGREDRCHRHCAVPMRDGWLVTDPIDARLWQCTACVLRAQQVLEVVMQPGAVIAPTTPLQVSDGPARDNGEAAHAGTTRVPGHHITSHHLSQALVARSLARDLRGNTL